MGHGALFVKYDKPSYKSHIAILLAIIAVSVFLSLKVAKNKEATNFVALKQPVPIDSIAAQPELPASNIEAQFKTDSEDTKEKLSIDPFVAEIVKPKPVTLASLETDTVTDATAVDHAQTIESQVESAIVAAVAADVANSTSLDLLENRDSISNSQTQTAELTASSDAALESGEAIENTGSNHSAEKLAAENIDSGATQVSEFSSNGSSEKTVAMSGVAEAEVGDVKQKIEKLKTTNSISLDEVYNKQQQNFLNTLAKSASTSDEADHTVKKIRTAISEDRTLDSDSDAKTIQPVKVKQSVSSSGKTTMPAQPKSNTESAYGKNTVAKLNNIKAVSITRSELNNVLSQFTYYYNSGDIKRLMNLFTESAYTNGQNGKQGIKNDYADLFNNTVARRLMIKNIKWDLNESIAKGAAEFEVIVQAKNGTNKNSFSGSLSITAVKDPNGIYITKLFHHIR